MGGVALVASGRGGSMAPAYDDRPDLALPDDRPIAAQDLRTVRFPLAFRGYRMSDVDDAARPAGDRAGGPGTPTGPTRAPTLRPRLASRRASRADCRDMSFPIVVWILTGLAAVAIVLTRLRLRGAAAAGPLLDQPPACPSSHFVAGVVALVLWLGVLVAPEDSLLGGPLVGILAIACWWLTAICGLLILARWLPAKGRHAPEAVRRLAGATAPACPCWRTSAWWSASSSSPTPTSPPPSDACAARPVGVRRRAGGSGPDRDGAPTAPAPAAPAAVAAPVDRPAVVEVAHDRPLGQGTTDPGVAARGAGQATRSC